MQRETYTRLAHKCMRPPTTLGGPASKFCDAQVIGRMSIVLNTNPVCTWPLCLPARQTSGLESERENCVLWL